MLTYFTKKVPRAANGLNRLIDFWAVMLEKPLAVGGALRTDSDQTCLWQLPLRELSWASLTSPNIFRSGYGLRVPYQAPKSALYYTVLGRLFVLSDSPRHFHPFALWLTLWLGQLHRAG